MARRSAEPLLWLLFSAGGVVAAMLIPSLLFLFGLAFPLGWLSPPSHEHLLVLLRHPLTRVVLFVLCMLFFFFQAEDGIRDLYVTGVQTCALPISAARARISRLCSNVLEKPMP